MRAVVEVQEIPLTLLRMHATALFEQHFDELSVDKDRGLDPHWTGLFDLEARGWLQCVAAYDDMSECVGYAINVFVPRHTHYAFAYVANDALFVTPAHRGARIGGKLMRATRDWAKRMGAAEVTWHAKEGTELHRRLDRSDRFVLRDIIYSERI